MKTNYCIMISMKRIILFITAIMFLSSTVTSVALADTCSKNKEPSEISKMMDMEDMPCHEAGKTDKENKEHCDGDCYCFHTAFNKVPNISKEVSLPLYEVKSSELHFINEIIKTRALEALFRPPISFS